LEYQIGYLRINTYANFKTTESILVYLRINTDIMGLVINNLQLDLGMKIVSELSKIDRFDASWSTTLRNSSQN
jgi:hypothetical protein